MIGADMRNEMPPYECEWKTNRKGNHVGYSLGGEFVATVFNNGHGWQIIINRDGVGHIVAGEIFDIPDDAQERAEWILSGADCTLSVMGARPRPRSAPPKTGWKQLSKTSNGSPTYGRKYKGKHVSVKKASNDNWFYFVHGSRPDGWSKTAKEAMRAFDIKHP
jgi:hypothetical protein